MTKDEALKLALEAIQDYVDEYGPHDKDSGAQYVITAIKAALLSRSDGEAKDEKQKPVNIKKVAEEHGINLPTEFVPKHDESKAAIQSLTDQCAALIWERDELQKQMWRSEKQEPVAHSVVAGALFDFMGWLTSREKRLILSSVDEASPAVEAITEFAKKRNLSLKYAEVGYWMEFLSTPPQREAKDEPVQNQLMALIDENQRLRAELKFNTTPPQRKPLTDEDIVLIVAECAASHQHTDIHFARAIEAAHGIKGLV